MNLVEIRWNLLNYIEISWILLKNIMKWIFMQYGISFNLIGNWFLQSECLFEWKNE